MPARARAWRPSCDGNALSNPDRGRIPCLTPRLVVLLSVRRCLQRREWLASFGAPKSSSSPAPEGGALGEEHLIILDNCERHGLEHRSIASSQSGHAGELSGHVSRAAAAAGLGSSISPKGLDIDPEPQLRVLLTLPQMLDQPGGKGSVILSPAGGLRAAGLSFAGPSGPRSCPRLCAAREPLRLPAQLLGRREQRGR